MAEADRDITVALTADTLIARKVSVNRDEGFLDVVKVLRDADVTFTNAECLFQNGEDSPAFIAGGGRGGTYMASPPYCIDELRWMGINLISVANNHSADFGEAGILTNNRYLDEAGMAHAGTGANLTLATAPAYLDTGAGRVALIAAFDWGPHGIASGDLPYPVPMGVLGADPSPAFPKGRAGVNLIRFETVHQVDADSLKALRRISQELKWDAAKAERTGGGGWDLPIVGATAIGGEQDTDKLFHFMGTKFELADRFGMYTVPHQPDLERNYKWIREARRQADWVIVSMHNHGARRTADEPADHVGQFARGAIDAGADIFVAHGSVRDGGIELYKDKPIIHGMRGLIMQNSQVTKIPLEMMERWGLDWDDTVADLHEARERRISSVVSSGIESTVTVVRFKNGELSEVRVVPIELGGRNLPRPRRGMPRLVEAGSEQADRILKRIAKLSQPFGTRLRVRPEAAYVELGGTTGERKSETPELVTTR
jgi:poly-gamma-glutamate capsule biosynthesis protein CapA/YwtB (metallophosphatase superfamily)